MWSLGFDLDSIVPHHSVLSKARKRWGMAVFRRFFKRVIGQCVEAGLVSGHKQMTEQPVDTAVADAQYGTIENLLKCNDQGVNTHMPHLAQAAM